MHYVIFKKNCFFVYPTWLVSFNDLVFPFWVGLRQQLLTYMILFHLIFFADTGNKNSPFIKTLFVPHCKKSAEEQRAATYIFGS